MKTSLIIAELDPACNIFLCPFPGRVGSPVDQLDFQGSVDTLGQRVVIAYSRAADRLPYPESIQLPGELG